MKDGADFPSNADYPADTLGMSEEQMRRLGHQVVDLIVDRLASRNSEPVIETGTFSDLAERLGGEIPLQPGDPDAALETLASVALAHQQHSDHPRYFARVPGPSSFAAVLGEWLASGFNSIAASWVGGSGPATLELIVTDWLGQLMGMPKGTEGVLVSGGSMANLTAMATARNCLGPGVVYLSDQTHSSIKRALHAMGLEPESVRVLPTDSQFRMSMQTLHDAILEDQRHGRTPIMVVASAGTTNTGAVDPLAEIAETCARHGMWFHVDGAYGAPATISPPGQSALSGIEKADSLVLDPHKWLFQPYDVGCVLVRRPGALANTFSMTPEYLRDVQGEDDEVDFRDRGLELTRRSRAAKLWMTIQTYGLDRIRDAISTSMSLADYAEKAIRSRDSFELVTPSQLGIVTFALRGCDDHAERAKQLSEDGFATLSSTTLKGRCVLRLCIINPLTTRADIDGTLDRLHQLETGDRFQSDSADTAASVAPTIGI